jgi:Tol biopolymer transport system component
VVNLASGESRTVANLTLKAAATKDGPFLNLSGWSPDGHVLIHRGAGSGAKPEWSQVPVTGEQPRPVTFGLPGGADTWSGIRWSPDGSKLVLVKSSSAYSAFVVEHPLAAAASTTSAQRR